MARIQICDGCSAQGDLGKVKKGLREIEYCEGCREKAEQYCRLVDAAQEEAATLFADRMNSIRAEIQLQEYPY